MKKYKKIELDQLRENLNAVADSPNKASGKEVAKKVQFQANVLFKDINPYAKEKLGHAISYAQEASGSTSSKDHWKQQMEKNWHLFQREIRNDPEET